MERAGRVAAAALVVAVVGVVGFDTSRHSVPVEDILAGGPAKDGIPAILAPRFLNAASATFLRPDDRVIGVVQGGMARAYPIRILNWHEVVNDSIGSTPVVVTYCPLTASGVVYDRRVNQRTMSFGVSGRLYQSNVLFYDHQTESLWSQLQEEAVTGRFTGTRLHALPSVTTSWSDWREMHPDTLVLSPDTGYQRDYERDPYAHYRSSPELMFPVRRVDRRFAPKERVFGLRVGNESKAYRLTRLAEVKQLDDQLGGTSVRIEYNPDFERVSAAELESESSLAGVVVYWFAWFAFHPDTQVWEEKSLPLSTPPVQH